MIRTIELTNFQSHEASTFELHPGVNAIVGPSDAGKTAILRALYWLVYNRPLGDAFVSHWNRKSTGTLKEETAVEVKLDDMSIRRERSKDKNGYHIEAVGSKDLEAIRSEVPEEISTALNMTEVNIQRQMDSPFLLADSPADVARFFNRTIRLDLIDALLGAVEAKRRQLIRDSKQNEEQAASIRIRLEALNWIDNTEKLLETSEKINHRMAKAQEQRDGLLESCDQWSLGDAIATATTGWLKVAIPRIKEAEALRESRRVARHQLVALDEMFLEYKNETHTVSRLEMVDTAEALVKQVNQLHPALLKRKADNSQLLDTLTQYELESSYLERIVDMSTIVSQVAQYEQTANRVVEARRTRMALQTILESYSTQATTITKSDDEILKLEAQMPDVCPLCGGPMKKER